jgi:hypothetical protein
MHVEDALGSFFFGGGGVGVDGYIRNYNHTSHCGTVMDIANSIRLPVDRSHQGYPRRRAILPLSAPWYCRFKPLV